MQTRTYFDHNAPRTAPELAPIPAADDPLTLRIRSAINAQQLGIEVHESRGFFLVKNGTAPVGHFEYRDMESFRQAEARAAICRSRYQRGSVEQVEGSK